MGFIANLLGGGTNGPGPQQTSNYGSVLNNSMNQTNQTLARQTDLANALQQQMTGGGPNLGQTQLQSALNQQNQQSAGLIAGQKGLNPQLGARQILQNNAQNSQAASNQSAQLQQQQQLGSQQQLGNVLGQQGALANQQVGTLGNLQNQQQQVANQAAQAQTQQGGGILGGIGSALGDVGDFLGLAHGGKVEAMVSPGEMIVPPGGNYDDGGIVPGQAQVAGDSPKNDTVPAKLPVGAVVVPRSVTGGGGPSLDPERVKNFMEAIKGGGYAKVVRAKAKWKGGEV